MEKLFRMMSRLFVVCLMFPSATAMGRDHCSLEVKVVNATGREIEAIVTVTEKDGRVQTADYKVGGVTFCDLGILPVTVKVGNEPCNRVTVQNVKLTWGETTVVKVIYDREPCLFHPPPGPVPTCRVLLRIVAHAERKGVPHAVVRLQKPYQGNFTTDQYGRVMLTAKCGPDLEGEVTHEGYNPTKFQSPCSRAQEAYEQYLILEKAPK